MQARSVQHLHSYCRGLLSDLPRKSIEPITLVCGTAVRTLQEFLRDHVWDHLDRAEANGVHLNWLTFDEHYGGKPAFLEDLDGRAGLHYLGEVPRNFRCLAVRPRGRKPTKGWTGKRVDNLARFSSAWNRRAWHGVSLARLTLDNQEWEVRAGQVYWLRRGELTRRTYWLIVARNDATGEIKYFISNAPVDTPWEKLLRVAFTRWNVEHTFRVVKSEIGFGHFEGRSYVALMRHMIQCLVVMGFAAEHTDRLRGENPEITLEQVCRALNQRCSTWQSQRRGTTAVVHTAEVIVYHQQRNRAARESRQKRIERLTI